MAAKNKVFHLLSGQDMPLIGFGTYQIRGTKLIRDVLDWALAAGYRNIDTAAVYRNEQDIGVALKELLPKYNLKRQDIFITSKLSPSDQGEHAYKAVCTSLQNLQCEYLDLYLIHWPGVFGIPAGSPENAKLRDLSWINLVRAKKEGIVKNIGVSNYMCNHLTELLNNCHGVKPCVNQVEWHPSCYDPDLQELCQKEGILLQAYSSLGGTGNRKLFNNPIVEEIANRLDKTPAQILLRWATQQNIAVIPKACSKERIENNIRLDFVIPNEYMAMLSKCKTERYAWNPYSVI